MATFPANSLISISFFLAVIELRALCFRSRPFRIVELPAAAQRLVELDEARQAVEARACQRVFGGELLLLGLKHIEIVRQAGEIALVRQTDRLLIGINGLRLLGLDL